MGVRRRQTISIVLGRRPRRGDPESPWYEGLDMRSRTLIFATMLVLSGITAIEAARVGHVGLAVLGGIMGALALAALVSATKPTVRLRSDLWSWVDGLSASTGEAPDDLVDRAVSAYRSRLAEGGEGRGR